MLLDKYLILVPFKAWIALLQETHYLYKALPCSVPSTYFIFQQIMIVFPPVV